MTYHGGPQIEVSDPSADEESSYNQDPAEDSEDLRESHSTMHLRHRLVTLEREVQVTDRTRTIEFDRVHTRTS